jgi:hypothetical protein
MKDKAHVFQSKGQTRGSGAVFGTFVDSSSKGVSSSGSATIATGGGPVRSILYLQNQQVVIVSSGDDLTAYDPMTGRVLYSMDGSFDFSTKSSSTDAAASCLLAVSPAMLITNGMGNYLCVHNYAMERLDDDNVDDFFDVFTNE